MSHHLTITRPSNQAENYQARRQQIADFTAAYCQEHYSKSGHWESDVCAPDTRKTLWLCFGLLANPNNAAAITLSNHILANLEFKHHSSTRTPEEAASQFDIFISNHAVQLLVVHGQLLNIEVIQKLETWARLALGDYPGDRQADYQFHGANDNMPSKASLGLILGGEYFNDLGAVAHGIWNLRQLANLLTRRGLISEYNSPTYLPLTLLNLTEIAQHAENQEAAALARQCSDRIWADILGHYHPGTRTVGGPYSRAYHLDSTGHFSTMNCLIWLTFGEDWAAFNPLDELAREPVRLVHHHSDRTTQLGVLTWLTACPLTPPEHLLEWTMNRNYPFHCLADAERGGQRASTINTTFYAEDHFAIGSSFGEPWSSMQSEAFFLQYGRRPEYSGIEDLRTVFARYLINDQKPPNIGEDDLLKPYALVHTLQKGRTALLLALPKAEIADHPLHTLKFSVVIPTHFGPVDQIEKVPSSKGGVCGDHVFIQDGPVYIGIRGLNATRHDSETTGCEIETTGKGDYQVISFNNYRGPERSFTRKEILETLNGCVVVIGLASEESFEAFKQRILNAELLDYYAFEQRTITYQLGDTHLSASYAPETNRIRYTTIDGLPMPTPRWQADDLPEAKLPFLGTRVHPTPLETFPYKHMKVIWEPNKKYQIMSPHYPTSNES